MSRPLTELSLGKIVRESRSSGKRRDVVDPSCPGLQLRVSRTRVTWRLLYTDRRTRRRERLTLGYYPDVPLAEARRRAMEERAKIEDPKVRASPARERREVAGSITFRDLAEMRLSAVGKDQLAESTLVYYRWSLERNCYGPIGDMPACEVRQADVAAIVDAVAARGSLVTADRTRASVGSVFAFGMRRGLLQSNPAAGLAPRAAPSARERVLSDAELSAVVRGIDDSGVSGGTRLALLLTLHTLQRSTEVRECRAEEMMWEGVVVRGARFAHPCWVIAGDRPVRGRVVHGRMKSGREQVLPMSARVRELFAEAQGERSEGLLLSVPSRHAVRRALSRICARAGVADCTVHDLRRTGATFAGERGVRGELVEAILHHSPGTITRQVYDRSKLLGPMLEALEAWSNHLIALAVEDQANNSRGESSRLLVTSQ